MTSVPIVPPADPVRLERNWRAITIELDAPRPGRLERLLRRLGLPAHLTRLMVSTPSLRRGWFGAMVLAIVVGLGATDPSKPIEDLFVLLLLTPLVPVLGVSLAYGVDADPAHEASLATPMSGLRLVLTRAAVVLGCSIVVLGLAALLTPSVPAMAFAWLIPSVGLTSATVGLMTFLPPKRAAATAAGTWVLLVGLTRLVAADPVAAFGVGGQVLLSGVAAAGLAVAYLRRDRFDLLRAA